MDKKDKICIEAKGIMFIGTREDLVDLRRIIVAGSVRSFQRREYYKDEDPDEILEEYYDNLGVWSHDLWRAMSKELKEDFKA